MRKYILALLTFLSVAAMQAADKFTLSYCEHEIASADGWGSDNEGEISAAIYVSQENLKTLVGNQISRIDVGLISRINVRNMTVWVRSSLDGANLAEATIERGALNWNEITLPSPYTIQAEDAGLYIGFSYKNTGSSHPVSFVGKGTKGTSFFKATAEDEWQDMAEQGNLSLEAIVTGSALPLYDLSLSNVYLTPNPAFGQNGYRIIGEVSNLALRDVTGFTLNIESGGADVQQVEVPQTVKSGATASFTADFTSNVPLSGQVKVTIANLKDGTDSNPDNNSAMGSVAFLRNVLIEEFTTEYCPNCPPTALGLHQALESNESYATRVSAVCHHAGFNTDWLTRDCDKDLLFLYNDGGTTFAPAITFDRLPIFPSNFQEGERDNVASIRQKEDFIECIELVKEIPSHALVSIQVKEATESLLTVEVSLLTDDECDLEHPILTVYATEDDVKAIAQRGADGTFYHQHVIRWDNGSWGDDVTFSQNAFSQTYTIPFEASWNKEKMYIVALLSNHDSQNKLNNMVENSAKISLASTVTGIHNAVEETEPQVIGRFSISGQRVTPHQKGIQLIKYSNGRTVKVLTM